MSAALCGLSGEVDPEKSQHLVHRVAQVAHGLAQGKVGSGFDVCAAVFGSMRYCRVSSEALGTHMGVVEAAWPPHATIDEVAAACRVLVGECDPGAWDFTATPFALPQGFKLMMADVRGGSETPSMVRKILAWRESGGAAAHAVWTALCECNVDIADKIGRLVHLAASTVPSDYNAGVALCAGLPSTEWAIQEHPVCQAAAAAAAAFLKYRTIVWEMGSAADVPVEPEAQRRKADATLALPGVMACGVPGAGGFDALFAIVATPDSLPGSGTVRQAVEALWSGLEGVAVCPLLLEEGPGVGQAGAGVQVEV